MRWLVLTLCAAVVALSGAWSASSAAGKSHPLLVRPRLFRDAQSAMTENTSDDGSRGIDFVIHLLHRRIDDLEARLAGLEAS